MSEKAKTFLKEIIGFLAVGVVFFLVKYVLFS